MHIESRHRSDIIPQERLKAFRMESTLSASVLRLFSSLISYTLNHLQCQELAKIPVSALDPLFPSLPFSSIYKASHRTKYLHF